MFLRGAGRVRTHLRVHTRHTLWQRAGLSEFREMKSLVKSRKTAVRS
jgi:hypothetical protein